MNIQNFTKSKTGKIVWGMVLTFSVMSIAKSGYEFGQWLHGIIN